MTIRRRTLALAALAPAAGGHLAAQGDVAPFRFSAEASAALRGVWRESIAVRQERVACLGGTIERDTVFVRHALPLPPDAADSLGTSAVASIDTCGPPAWLGIAHTHIAPYHDDGQPSRRFSGRTAR